MVTANHHPALFREPFFILNGIGHERKGHLCRNCPRKYIKRRTLHFQTTDLREIPVLFWPSSLENGRLRNLILNSAQKALESLLPR